MYFIAALHRLRHHLGDRPRHCPRRRLRRLHRRLRCLHHLPLQNRSAKPDLNEKKKLTCET